MVTQANYLNLSKFAEGTLSPTVYVIDDSIKQTGPSKGPWGTLLITEWYDAISPSSENMWDGTDLSSPETCCSANMDSIQRKGN